MVEFKQETKESVEILCCTFVGRLDTEECNKDGKLVEAQLKIIKSSIVFDLEKVEYVSSAFLRICIQAVKCVGKDKFSIVKVPPFVMKVLKIAGLDSMLTIS
ncbi:MAG: STAS domain-containing protein [Oligoflexia bacterium]|nr:STAS domain-containing protein [Oligoflexia bacterium]